jgi:hypothetical protein
LQLTRLLAEDIFCSSGTPFFIPVPDVHERVGALWASALFFSGETESDRAGLRAALRRFFSKAMVLQLPPLNGAQVCACRFFKRMRPHLLRGMDVQWMDSAELCASNYRA